MKIGEDEMIPDERVRHRPWWDTRIDPPSNRSDSFNAIVKQDKRKNKRNYLKGKK